MWISFLQQNFQRSLSLSLILSCCEWWGSKSFFAHHARPDDSDEEDFFEDFEESNKEEFVKCEILTIFWWPEEEEEELKKEYDVLFWNEEKEGAIFWTHDDAELISMDHSLCAFLLLTAANVP